MKDLKRQFQKDFEESSPQDLSFDLNQLKETPVISKQLRRLMKASMPRRPINRGKVVAIVMSSVLAASLIAVSIPLGMAMFRVQESVRTYKRSYSANETALAQSNTFHPINQVAYPNREAPEKKVIQDAERVAYESFANRTYRALLETSKKDNMSYSPVGLYSVTNEMVAACSNLTMKEKLNDLLGLTENSRPLFYDKVMAANSYAKENSSIQLKNGAFFTNQFAYSLDYVSALTRLYCEAYQLDFGKDADKIVEWANLAVNSPGFINKDFLEMDAQSVLYLISTFYFKNAWSSKYLADDNVVEPFYLRNGATIDTEYMRHSYFADCYWDYGDYIAVKDFYHHGYASVTYLVPKRVEDDILTLTKDVNIFAEDATKSVRKDGYGSISVHLKTPKFSFKTETDFRPCFESLGLGDAFNPFIDSFHNAFDDENAEGIPFYLQTIKQKNEVEFNEDGSIVRSLTMAGFAAGSAAPFTGDTLEVDLNQPFIYVIRDLNGTPIFMGHVDNPKG